MEDILYIIRKNELFVPDGESDLRRRIPDDARGFDELRSVKKGMERARDFVQVLMAENIVGDGGRPEDQNER